MTMVEYALTFLGTPYLWGGNTPQGWDCSGFICEVLRAYGHLDRNDYSSQMIYDQLVKINTRSQLSLGSVLFFGNSRSSITHVAMAIDEKGTLMVESGGGDSKTTTLKAAREKNAFVRVRPINSRRDLVGCIKII